MPSFAVRSGGGGFLAGAASQAYSPSRSTRATAGVPAEGAPAGQLPAGERRAYRSARLSQRQAAGGSHGSDLKHDRYTLLDRTFLLRVQKGFE